jgi:hypothetical protein
MFMLHNLKRSISSKGIVQTNNLTDVMNPLMMCSPLIYSFHQIHSFHPNFYDRILEWFEDSYLKNLHNKDKGVLALFLPKYLGSKHHMIFLDPPCEEIDEHLENCQEDGTLRSRLMVISSPHNSHELHNLIFSYFCDPYNDKIAEWLEDSYKKNVQGNGQVMLVLFLNDDDNGKYDIFLIFFDILPFLLLIFYLFSIAGLELLRWLHWKYDFT